MAIKLTENNSYKASQRTGIWANSLELDWAYFVKSTGNIVDKAGAGERIVGVNDTEATYASDNQTVAKAVVNYTPDEADRTYKTNIAGQVITFSGALVTDNTIDLKINGVAMTQVPFNTSDAQTLADIATQIETDFASVIFSAAAGTNSVVVVGDDVNSTVVITEVVVAAGASQATATVGAIDVTADEETTYFDLVSADLVDGSTGSTTTWQVELVSYDWDQVWDFQIVNL